jgi:hypothetical protein
MPSITAVAVAPVVIIHRVKPVLPPLTVLVMRFLTAAALARVVFIRPAMVVFQINKGKVLYV